MLNNNYLRALPYELGKLFQLATLGLKVGWVFFQKRIFIILFRATRLGLMCCSCSQKWMERESSWTLCSTTLLCPPATHSPGKYSDQISSFLGKHSNKHFMSLVQALDPASTLGQGEPYRPFHSHVLQCSLWQVVPSFIAPLFIFLLTRTQINLPRYATRSLYGYCPQWALNWEYR